MIALRTRIRVHRDRATRNAALLDLTHDIAVTELNAAARRAAREVVYRHRLDPVSTEVLLQPIYSMAASESVTA